MQGFYINISQTFTACNTQYEQKKRAAPFYFLHRLTDWPLTAENERKQSTSTLNLQVPLKVENYAI